MLEPRFCGLPFSRLQYQYRFFTNGLSRIINMGQTPYDGSIAHLPDNRGSVGSSRGKYSLASSVKTQGAESTCFLRSHKSVKDSFRVLDSRAAICHLD